MKSMDGCPIVLSGFMGAGKSSIGRIVAERLHFNFIDIDDYVCKLAGRSISDMLKQGQIDKVRSFEKQAVNELKYLKHAVIATGAGVMATKANADAFAKAAFVVYIRRDFEILYPIISQDLVRVMAYQKSRETLLKLYKERDPIYTKYADSVLINDASPEACAAAVIEEYHNSIPQRRNFEQS